jgi:hypothetical protein
MTTMLWFLGALAFVAARVARALQKLAPYSDLAVTPRNVSAY